MQVFRCPNGYRVGIVNRWTVESLDATTESAPDTILISIHGSRDQKARVSAPFRDILFLRFDDLDKPLAGYRLMSEGDAQAVLDFISRNKDCKNILCQCEAGVSRSAGCAAAIIKWLEGEDEAVFASDLYSPNRHVYRLMLRVIRKQSKSQRPG
jgi:predicted protein tyrosine phosphatase